MPRISANSGNPNLGSSSDPNVITRVDITPEDIRNMTDEQIHNHLSLLRRNREVAPVKKSRSTSAGPSNPKSSNPKQPKQNQVVEDDMENFE